MAKKEPGSSLKEPGKYLATTYSHRTYRPTTIGAAAFHFRVRNGTGWFHCALVTRGQHRSSMLACVSVLDSGELSYVFLSGGMGHELMGWWRLLSLPVTHGSWHMTTASRPFCPLSDIHMEIVTFLFNGLHRIDSYDESLNEPYTIP
jgi:hypothetical protein